MTSQAATPAASTEKLQAPDDNIFGSDHALHRLQNARKKMLPEPALALTIPSVHDGTVLDCRIYHPVSLTANPHAPPWQRHAAVLAHPYAPMGGSYDDPLLGNVAAQLLRKGYLVGMFNFRGAAHSAGRTSWTARPEHDDYISFIGFMVHYIHHLDPFHHHGKAEASSPENVALPHHRPILLIGGYSYGAIITTQLPPLHDLLEPFASPESGSDAAQIRLRAESLAEQQNVILRDARAAMVQHRAPSSPARHGVRIGGGEGGASPRRSHESFGRRSFSLDAEGLRKGVHDLLAKTKSVRHKRTDGHHAEKPADPPANGKLPPVDNLVMPRPAYLLVSPPRGLVTHLATMSLVPSAFVRHKGAQGEAAEAKLVQNPTLVVYGDNDAFVSAGKLRGWAAKMSAQQGSMFRAHEVESAGHFWAEEGVLFSMLDLSILMKLPDEMPKFRAIDDGIRGGVEYT